MFTKRYAVGRLSFEVNILPDFTIELIRLPVIKVDYDAEASFHSEQMCTVVHVECPPQWVIDNSISVDGIGDNAGHYAVAEYIGRESSSENLTPDTALDGFLDWELGVALETLSGDDLIAEYIKSHYGIKTMLTG